MTNSIEPYQWNGRWKLRFSDHPQMPIGPRLITGVKWPWDETVWAWDTEDDAWEHALMAMDYLEHSYV